MHLNFDAPATVSGKVITIR